MRGEVQHMRTPAVGYGSARRGGALGNGNILKACSATGNVSFLGHSLADWGFGCFETYSCSDYFLPVATALILRSSAIAAFSFVTFLLICFLIFRFHISCWDFKLSLYLSKCWFSFSLFPDSVAEIMNPVYSPGSSGVPYANAKGIGYPGKQLRFLMSFGYTALCLWSRRNSHLEMPSCLLASSQSQNLFWDWGEDAFKFKKWHLKTDVISSVIFLTSVSLPMQLILGALIITPCKKRRQSISAASWLALLTFLSSNSCSCYLFSDCPKHGIKGGTKKMAKNVFETEVHLISCFICFSLTQSFSRGSPPSPIS